VNVPRSGVNPERVLELALDIEQPDASRDGNSYDGHLDNKERLQVNKRDHCLDHGRNSEIRRHRAEPRLPTTPHHADWEPVLDLQKSPGYEQFTLCWTADERAFLMAFAQYHVDCGPPRKQRTSSGRVRDRP
jgi:hypothetical protein